MRRDDYLVRRRHKLLERIPDHIDGVGIDDEAVRGDAVRAQQIERAVEPAPRGGAARVLVDDVAVTRLTDRADDGDADRPLVPTALEQLDEALSGDGLVGNHEQVAQLGQRVTSSASAGTSSSFVAPSSEKRRGVRQARRTRTGRPRSAGSRRS